MDISYSFIMYFEPDLSIYLCYEIEITLHVKMIIPFVSLIHVVNESYSYFNWYSSLPISSLLNDTSCHELSHQWMVRESDINWFSRIKSLSLFGYRKSLPITGSHQGVIFSVLIVPNQIFIRIDPFSLAFYQWTNQ